MKLVRGMLVCVAGFVFAAGADEGGENAEAKKGDQGIRVSLGSAPGWNEFDIGGVALETSEDVGGQFEVLYQKRFWRDEESRICGVFGGGLFFSSNSGEVTDGVDTLKFDTGAFGGILQGGAAARLGSRVVVEVLPYVGFGGGSTEVSLDGMSDDGDGTYIMYGLKGGVFVKLAKAVELGAEVGVQGHTVDIKVEGADDWKLSGDGARAALVLNIRL